MLGIHAPLFLLFRGEDNDDNNQDPNWILDTIRDNRPDAANLLINGQQQQQQEQAAQPTLPPRDSDQVSINIL